MILSDDVPKYRVCLTNGFQFDLPIVPTPGGSIAYFNIEDDYHLASSLSRWLSKEIWPNPENTDNPYVLAMPAGKATPLLHAIANTNRIHKCWDVKLVVAQKEIRSVMRGPIVSYSYKSITTDRIQTLHFDANSLDKIKGQRVAIVDDVVSSGGSIEAMKRLIELAGGTVTGVYAVFTEGGPKPGVTALGDLPFPCPLPIP